jgi:hypothetical protein
MPCRNGRAVGRGPSALPMPKQMPNAEMTKDERMTNV